MQRTALNRRSLTVLVAVVVALLMPAGLTLVRAANGNSRQPLPQFVSYDKNHAQSSVAWQQQFVPFSSSNRASPDTANAKCAHGQSGPVGDDADERSGRRLPENKPGGSKFFCDDFNGGTAGRWEPMGGVWKVEGGQYVGEGMFDRPCPGFSSNEALIRDLEASNVDVQLDMQSIQRVDKGIILRSTGAGSQIELNFRAERPGAFPADLIVQEVVNCQFILYTPEFSVLIPPHQVGETIHVRVKLIGNRLRVWIDGRRVLDRSFPFAATKGQTGLAVIDGGITAFDNVRVHVLK